MKRHPAIQPLSRQHHTLLLAVLLLKKGMAKNASLAIMVLFVNEVWKDVMLFHTQQEEDVLIPAFQEGAVMEDHQIIMADHKALEQLYQQLNTEGASYKVLQDFVSLLEKHIRFEERHYFPKLEALANTNTWEQLSNKIIDTPNSCLQFSPRFWE